MARESGRSSTPQLSRDGKGSPAFAGDDNREALPRHPNLCTDDGDVIAAGASDMILLVSATTEGA
jgi:hypothetical protein